MGGRTKVISAFGFRVYNLHTKNSFFEKVEGGAVAPPPCGAALGG